MKQIGDYNKIIIWGHPLYSHTTSYVMHGYYKALKSMGYDVYHTNDGFEDVKNAIIITEGVVDANVPLDKSNFYVLHNCIIYKYINVGAKFMHLQVWTKDCMSFEEINPYTYKGDDVLFQPWATDLLPEEIDVDDIIKPDTDEFYWVGTYGDRINPSGNGIFVDMFINRIRNHGISFIHIDPWSNHATFDDNKNYIRRSYVAPAIVGTMQKKNGYMPCRIWKNISYGHFGATNSLKVAEVFESHGVSIVYNSNEFALADDCVEFRNNPDYNKIVRQQKMAVKEFHTFINRATELLNFIEGVI